MVEHDKSWQHVHEYSLYWRGKPLNCSQSLVFQLDPNHPESTNCCEHLSMYGRIPTAYPRARTRASTTSVTEHYASQRGNLLAVTSHTLTYCHVWQQLSEIACLHYGLRLHLHISTSFQFSLYHPVMPGSLVKSAIWSYSAQHYLITAHLPLIRSAQRPSLKSTLFLMQMKWNYDCRVTVYSRDVIQHALSPVCNSLKKCKSAKYAIQIRFSTDSISPTVERYGGKSKAFQCR